MLYVVDDFTSANFFFHFDFLFSEGNVEKSSFLDFFFQKEQSTLTINFYFTFYHVLHKQFLSSLNGFLLENAMSSVVYHAGRMSSIVVQTSDEFRAAFSMMLNKRNPSESHVHDFLLFFFVKRHFSH
jgi:hypothetical protein